MIVYLRTERYRPPSSPLTDAVSEHDPNLRRSHVVAPNQWVPHLQLFRGFVENKSDDVR